MDVTDAIDHVTPDFILSVWKRVLREGGPYRLTGIPERDIRLATLTKIRHYLQGVSRDATPYVPASLLLHHIVVWRPFVDANNQTGWIVCREFLDLFGLRPIVSEDEVVRFVGSLQGAKRDGEVRALNWVRQSFQP